MDKDEFQAWKDSPATQWVLSRLLERSQRVEELVRERLFHSTGLSAAEWSNLQAQAGYERGLVAGLNFVIGLEHEEVDAGEITHSDSERVNATR